MHIHIQRAQQARQLLTVLETASVYSTDPVILLPITLNNPWMINLIQKFIFLVHS